MPFVLQAEPTELRRHRDQLRLLSEVSEAIASHGDLTGLFRDLARRLPAVLPFEVIALFLHDADRNVLRVHMLGTADADRIPPGLEMPVEDSYSGQVFTTQEPLVVLRTEADTRFPASQVMLREIGVESFAVFPLTTIKRQVGAIGFGSRQPCPFSENDLEFLQMVSRQVAVAVDNVLHHASAKTARAELSLERDRLRMLLDVSESIASYRDPQELFAVLSQRLPRLVPFDFINLVQHDPARNVMQLQILTTNEPTTFRQGSELPVEDSPAGFVWQTQTPLLIPDLREDDRFPKIRPQLLENGVRTYCAVPLTTALRRIGALGFGSLQPGAYNAADVEFMQHMAAQVAVAVDNVLHDESARTAQLQLSRERDRLRLLLEVNNAVVSRLDLDEMFAAIAASLARAIPHDGCSLVLHDSSAGRYRCHVLKANGQSSVQEGRMDECVASPSDAAVATKTPTVLTEHDLREMAPRSEVAVRLLEYGVKAFLCAPLVSRDRVLGTLNVGRLREDAFTPEDAELLGQVAQQVAIGIENGLAYREIADLKERLNKERLYLEDEIRTTFNFGEIVGQSPALGHVLRQVEIVAPTDSTVLIQGETGTGKELIARAIHDLSGRQARTFVKLNCAAIPTGLLESELFGHEKGAFTGAISQKIGRFELAQGGTLFLDEVGDIPLELQSKFLRVLQEQEFERLGGTRTIRVDIRLVAATNRDLSAMVASREFRSDLFYRLNVFPIQTPPLRDRAGDVPRLVQYFTQKFARRMKKPITAVPVATMDALAAYHWPGNVRELENFIERAVILTRGSDLEAPLGELRSRPAAPVAGNGHAASESLSTLEDAEREHILRALRESRWVVGGPSGAASRLGMKRTTLQSRMEKLGIEKPAVPG
jgi:formate hydrogenlyase transcriptional activator